MLSYHLYVGLTSRYFLHVSQPKLCVHVFLLPCVPHAPPISSSMTWTLEWYRVIQKSPYIGINRILLFSNTLRYIFRNNNEERSFSWPDVHVVRILYVLYLTFWCRNYFFLIFAHPVYKMWIIQEPNTLELWKKLLFEEEKTESI